MTADRCRLPPNGIARDELWRAMEDARRGDAGWRDGRLWSLTYYADDDLLDVAREAYIRFFTENGLSARAFPSLGRFESDVVAMTANLLHGGEAVGCMTSGGSESLLLAVKTARDHARVELPDIVKPNIVVPATAHPTFEKAGHYFGLTVTRTPVRADFRADPRAMRDAVTDQTILVVGSAPSYTHGVVDPVADIAAIAQAQGISCHVDACLGGFVLPFLERLGQPVPPFDFRTAGVTSISADVHKYGFAAKGASTVLYRSADVLRFQEFSFRDWPSGEYRTATMTGTRPGGAIAAAWAVMKYLGEAGYMRLVSEAMETTRRLIAGVGATPGIVVWGQPDMSVFSFGSPDRDIYAVADGLAERGWYVNRQVWPPGIHLTVTPGHARVVGKYLDDLGWATTRATGTFPRTAPAGVQYA